MKKILAKHFERLGKILSILVLLYVGITSVFLYSNSFFGLAPLQPSPQEEARWIFDSCVKVSGDQTAHEKCAAQKFASIGEQWGIEFIDGVLSTYQVLYKDKGYQGYQSCHVLAHVIGGELASREFGRWKDLIAKMNAGLLDPTRCGGGFIHGVLEVRAGEDPDFKVNAGLFQELCSDTLRPDLSNSCAHILGHLALVEAYGKVPEALKACDGLSGEFLFQCYGGIFMEDSMRTNLNEHGLAELPERNMNWLETQVSRCNRYAGNKEIATGCWYDLPEVFLQTHGYNLPRTYKFCGTAPNKEARDQCYIRASYLVAQVPDAIFPINTPKELCSAYESGSAQLTKCMQDVVGAALTSSMSLTDRMTSFCSVRSGSARDQCFEFIAHHTAR